ncbi:MAG: hypothetical protein V1847_04390 [Candidatus Diapherotrites archaeon]
MNSWQKMGLAFSVGFFLIMALLFLPVLNGYPWHLEDWSWAQYGFGVFTWGVFCILLYFCVVQFGAFADSHPQIRFWLPLLILFIGIIFVSFFTVSESLKGNAYIWTMQELGPFSVPFSEMPLIGWAWYFSGLFSITLIFLALLESWTRYKQKNSH